MVLKIEKAHEKSLIITPFIGVRQCSSVSLDQQLVVFQLFPAAIWRNFLKSMQYSN